VPNPDRLYSRQVQDLFRGHHIGRRKSMRLGKIDPAADRCRPEEANLRKIDGTFTFRVRQKGVPFGIPIFMGSVSRYV
jgi:hypothetical protein